MKLPIDTTRMTFMAVGPPQPVTDFETKQPRVDATGTPLYGAQVVALCDGDGGLISVKVPGDPGRFGPGIPLRVTGLVASPWVMGERSGIAYRAEKIEAVNSSAKTS